MGGDRHTGTAKDEVTYFFLIKRSAVVSESQKVKGINDITKLVSLEYFGENGVTPQRRIDPHQRPRSLSSTANISWAAATMRNPRGREGGRCRLYLTSGAAVDFVSAVTGITSAGAIRIATEIEKRGIMKATLISGMEIFYAT
jgi:hypothetical protein